MSRNNLDYSRIGEKIRKTRLEKNLTQEYLATVAEVNPSHISNIEKNRVKISLGTLINLSNALGVTVDYLISDEYLSPETALESSILAEARKLSLKDQKRLIKIIQALQE